MSDREDVLNAIKSRERSRSWMRVATVTVGAGALVTTGVVAYTLPNPPQHTAARTVTPSSSPTQATRTYGDDGGEDGAAPAPSASPGQTPAHTTTGGS